jgi:hypothetical protein
MTTFDQMPGFASSSGGQFFFENLLHQFRTVSREQEYASSLPLRVMLQFVGSMDRFCSNFQIISREKTVFTTPSPWCKHEWVSLEYIYIYFPTRPVEAGQNLDIMSHVSKPFYFGNIARINDEDTT